VVVGGGATVELVLHAVVGLWGLGFVCELKGFKFGVHASQASPTHLSGQSGP